MPDSGTMRLGDFFSLRRGTTYKSSLLEQPGPVLLGLATIARNGGFRDDSLRTYGGECPAEIMVSAGQLYLSLKDVTQTADLLGAVARLPERYAPGRLTQDTVRLIPVSREVPLDYLYWLLRTPQYRDYCRSHATGTTNLGLAREDFLAFEVPPLTATRERLVALLGALDDKIDLNRRMCQTLEEMARALFKSWFVDFDPVRAKMVGRDPGLPKEIADLFPSCLVDSELGPIPEGWTGTHLGEFAALNPESWTVKTRPDFVRYLDLASAKWGRFDRTQQLCGDAIPSRAQRVLRPGDTVVGTVRPGNGSFGLIYENGLTGSTGFAVLRPSATHARVFVYLASTAAESIDRLSRLADGGAYPAVRPDVVGATPCAHPPVRLLEQLEASAGPWLDRIAACESESRSLAALRDTLLPKLISGEVRVPASLGSMQEVVSLGSSMEQGR